MIFCGMVGIKDPARTEVPISIGKCVDVQIRVIVITGDKPETATAICKEINVFSDDLSEQDVKSLPLTHSLAHSLNTLVTATIAITTSTLTHSLTYLEHSSSPLSPPLPLTHPLYRRM